MASWMLVGLVTAEPQQELPEKVFLSFFNQIHFVLSARLKYNVCCVPVSPQLLKIYFFKVCLIFNSVAHHILK